MVGSGMCSGCNSSQSISTVSLTILATVVSPIRKLNTKAWNDIPVERYLKQMNTYVLNFTNHKRCTCDITSRIAMEKAALNKKKTLFTSKLDLNLRKKLVKCYTWSKALYGAETWTFRAADKKYLESFEM